jgi:hypothetical protein
LGSFFIKKYRSKLFPYVCTYRFSINFDKKWVGLHYGLFFSQNHLIALFTGNKNLTVISAAIMVDFPLPASPRRQTTALPSSGTTEPLESCSQVIRGRFLNRVQVGNLPVANLIGINFFTSILELAEFTF